MKRTATRVLVLLLALPLFPAAQPQTPPSVLKGTIQAVEPETGSVEVVTGVGMALRLVRLRATTATRVVPSAVTPGLRRGDVVRVQVHWTDQGLVADRIEKVVTP
jgi:hypothetical protein